MVDFIAVEREHALRGEKLRYGRLAAAGAARHADEPHTGEERVFDLFLCQRALAQNFEGLLRQIEDRGLARERALAAVDHAFDPPVKVGEHLLRCRGAGRAGGICRRSGERQPRALEQREREPVRRAAQTDGVFPGPDDGRDNILFRFKHECERSRPEPRGKDERRRGDMLGVLFDFRRTRHHERERLYLRAALDLVEMRDRLGVKTVGAETVHRLRRHGHQTAEPQRRRGDGDIVLFGINTGFHALTCLRFRNFGAARRGAR